MQHMTIKELADLCNTHKTGIRRTIDRLELADQLERDENGVIQVPETVAQRVVNHYQNSPKTPQNVAELVPEQAEQQDPLQVQNSQQDALQAAIEALTAQLKAKDQQIEAMQGTIDLLSSNVAQLTGALSAAQALNAGTLQTFQQIQSVHMDEPAEEKAADQTAEDQQQEAEAVHVAHVGGDQQEPEPEQPKRRSFFGRFWKSRN